MSVDYISYCGPVAICKAKKVIYNKIKQGVCISGKTCAKFCNIKEGSESPTNKYCSDCGAKLYDIKYTIEDYNDPFYITEELKESLSIKDCENFQNIDKHIFIPNKDRNNPRKFHLNIKYGETDIVILDKNKIEEELNWFKLNFKKEIKYLQNFYGPENVRLEFLYYTEIFC